LEADLDYQVVQQWIKRQWLQLQEEADRKQAAKDTTSTSADAVMLEQLLDLDADLNRGAEQQRSKLQRLQSEADKKLAAAKDMPNKDGDTKMPAANRQKAAHPQPDNHQTTLSEGTTGTSNTDNTPTWLRRNNTRVSLDGVVHANRPIPLYIQQWIRNQRRNVVAV